MNGRVTLGRRGEDLAAQYLIEHGYRILDRNWRCSSGELDIVAGAGPTVVVVEVKTRRSLKFGPPLESITAAKASRLRDLARLWMRATETRGAVRIDAIGIVMSTRGIERFDHIQAIS